MGSTPSTLAALIRAWSLSDCELGGNGQQNRGEITKCAFATRGSESDNCLLVAAAATHSNLNAIVGEDQRRVGRCELGGRHCD